MSSERDAWERLVLEAQAKMATDPRLIWAWGILFQLGGWYAIPQDIPRLVQLGELGVRNVFINSGVTSQGLHDNLPELPGMYAWLVQHDARFSR